MTDPNSNKVAVVTGSATGIGRAMAIRLAADGFAVIIHAAKNRDAANTAAEQIAESSGSSDVVMCDFKATRDLSGFVRECWDWKNRIDVWVNNAGADVLTGEAAGWDFQRKLDALWDVDVRSTIMLSRLVGELMRHQPEQSPGKPVGAIINMGWDQAMHGMAGDSGQLFAASKGAIMAVSQSLAQSLAPAVRVNCLAPGWIRTAWGETASASWQSRACRESLMQRWGTPQDVAAVTSFLASDAASFVNGQIIPINGGFRVSSSEEDM